jgi:hypothetical protein
MVKVHRALGETTSAVGAWDRSQLIEQISPMTPSNALVVDPRRDGRCSASEPFPVASACPETVTVRADDIALRGFGQDLLAVLERRAARAEGEGLFAGIAVIKVHLVRRKPPGTVVAWNVTELAQERGRRVLSTPDPLDFAFAIGRVVPNIVRALITLALHG